MTELVFALKRGDDKTFEEFRRYYEEEHAPIGKRAPNLQEYRIIFPHEPAESEYDAITTVTYEDIEAMEESMESDAFQEAIADADSFANMNESVQMTGEEVHVLETEAETDMDGAETPTEPSLTAGGSGDTQGYELLDSVSFVLVPGSATGGRQSVVEMRLRDGHMPPMHVHKGADETIHVADGKLIAHTREKEIELSPGNTVYLPRNVPHSIEAKEQTKIVVTTMPAGYDEFVRAAGKPTDKTTPPTNPPDEEAIERVHEHANSFDIEIVGPPPKPH